MTTLADAFVRIRPEMGQFANELKTKAEIGAGPAGKQVGTTFGKSMVSAITGLLAAGAVVGFFKGAIEEATQAQKVGKLTEAVIRSTGGAAKVTAKDIDTLAGRLSELSGVDDDAIQSGANLLLTFTNIRNEVGKGNDIFDQATATVLDMSAALGQDMKAGAIQLGKALNDPIAGVSALSEVGVSFTAQQKEQIKAMQQAGDVMGAQKIILAELAKEFGGAAAAAKTPADEMRVAWANLQEDLGNKLLPTLNDIIHFGIQNQEWLVPLVASIGAAVLATKSLKAAQDTLGLSLEATAVSAGRVVGALGLAYTAMKAIESSGVGEKFDDILVKMHLISEETARDKSLLETVWGRGGPMDRLLGRWLDVIQGGPDVETSLRRVAKSTGDVAVATDKAADKGKLLLDVWNDLNGTMKSADEAMLDAERSIEDITEAFKEGGKAVQGNSLAALENRVALEQAAQAAAEAAQAYLDNGGSAEGAAQIMDGFRKSAEKATGATGSNAAAVHDLAVRLFQLPAQKAVVITFLAQNLDAIIAKFYSFVKTAVGKFGWGFAEGGIIRSFADGGMENHVAQIVQAGVTRVWNESEAGGEAYIPLALSKRARSTQILAEVARMFNMALLPLGSGEAVAGGGFGGGSGAQLGQVVGLLGRLIDAVERVAPGVGRELNGSADIMHQLARAW